MKKIVLILALLSALFLLNASAEERHLGEYIYMPSSQAAVSGNRYLRVEGIGFEQDGSSAVYDSLSGAQFCVYAKNADGQIKAWANPLFPTEPMRIRTAEDGATFFLPENGEFYLLQEATQQGFVFDADAFIPVDSETVVVQNLMAAEVEILVRDSQGIPIPEVELHYTDSDGKKASLRTDAGGKASVTVGASEEISVEEVDLPENVFPALRIYVNGMEAQSSTVFAEAGKKTYIIYEHPASGKVEVQLVLRRMEENGEFTQEALEGVQIEIEGQGTLETDSQGFAEATLLEGNYVLHLRAPHGVYLPVTDGQMVVESGNITRIELEAVQNESRIIFETEQPDAAQIELYDSEGKAVEQLRLSSARTVTKALAPGLYRVSFTADEGRKVAALNAQGALEQSDDSLTLQLEAGMAAHVQVELSEQKTQKLHIQVQKAGPEGETVTDKFEGTAEAALSGGNEAQTVHIESGETEVHAFAGQYQLILSEADARRLGVEQSSLWFDYPSKDGTVTFNENAGRILIHAVDSDGKSLIGGMYQISDAKGKKQNVETDGDGIAVTDVLPCGSAVIECVKAPEGTDLPEMVRVDVAPGTTASIELIHPRLGEVHATVYSLRIGDDGEMIRHPFSGARLRFTDGSREVDAEADEQGKTSVFLPEGRYQVFVQEAEAGTVEVHNGDNTEIDLDIPVNGGAEVVVSDALGALELSQIQFALEDSSGSRTNLQWKAGRLIAGGLEPGAYQLIQTRVPSGYTALSSRMVQIEAGKLNSIPVSLSQKARLSVRKYGLTFDDRLNSYLVPLTGCYGVYSKKENAVVPYPGPDNQAVVWAHASFDPDHPDTVSLPAEEGGTEYFLQEIDGSAGFSEDTEMHSVLLYPGQDAEVEYSVVSEKGFFTISVFNEAGEPVYGSTFELLDENGALLDTFTVEGSYQPEKALPVGNYIVREKEAAPDTLLVEEERALEIVPYLMQGGSMAALSFTASRMPNGSAGSVSMQAGEGEAQIYFTPSSLEFDAPQMTISLLEPGQTSLSGIRMERGTDWKEIAVRAEHHLLNGGWQMDKALLFAENEEVEWTLLPEEEGQVDAIRLSFLTEGEERLETGVAPGVITVRFEQYGTEDKAVPMQAQFTADVEIRASREEQLRRETVTAGALGRVQLRANGDPVPSAKDQDGKIFGFVFADSNADGVLNADESGRIQGVKVTLFGENGDVLAQTETDDYGRYAFIGLGNGTYRLNCEAAGVVFAQGESGSEYIRSALGGSEQALSEPFEVSNAQMQHLLLAGACRPAALTGGIVWEGSLIPAENEAVVLRRGDVLEAEARTDVNGTFTFEMLLPGTYTLQYMLPSGVLCDQGEDGEFAKQIVLKAEETKELEPILIFKEASVHGTVVIDENGDGQLAQDNMPVDHVAVTLCKEEDGQTVVLDERETDSLGQYAFDGLTPGRYFISMHLADEWAFTQYGTDSAVYASASGIGSSDSFDLQAGEFKEINAGITRPATLTVSAYGDTRRDGIRQLNENGIEDVQITLIRLENGADTQTTTIYTGLEGTARFNRVSPGTYCIEYLLPGSWRPRASMQEGDPGVFSDSYEAQGRSRPFILQMGSDLSVLLPAVQSGAINGQAYYDDNSNAVRDESEKAADNIPVTLCDAAGNPLMQTYTDENGVYRFEGMSAGRYLVRFEAALSERFSGNTRSVARGGVRASETNVSQTALIYLTEGEVNGVDAGIVRPAYIRGSLFVDRNGDGIRDEGEEGLSNAQVNLTSESGRSVLNTVMTDASGSFAITTYPGVYRVRLDPPEEFVYSGNTDGQVLSIEYTSGQWSYSVPFQMIGNAGAEFSFGFMTQGQISGLVWNDADYDGLMTEQENGMRSVRIELLDGNGAVAEETVTDRNGRFVFNGLKPDSYSLQIELESGYVYTVQTGESAAPRINNTVCTIPVGTLGMGEVMPEIHIGALKPAQLSGNLWYDQDNDGRRNPGEQPFSGTVTLTYLDGKDEGEILQASADANGKYLFNCLMPGTVQLQMEVAGDYAFARRVQGTQRVSIMQETDALSATSDSLQIASGNIYSDRDIGIVGVGSVQGNIWVDGSYTGREDRSSPLPMAKVLLYDASGMARETETDTEGRYVFERVRKGEYTVEYHLPDDMLFTREGDSAVAALDESVGAIAPFSLDMGENKGLAPVGAVYPANLSGRIVDEDTGKGVSGITVCLMEGGTQVGSTTSDEEGNYKFEKVRPGVYRLRYEMPGSRLFALSDTLKKETSDAHEAESDMQYISMGDRVALNTVSTVEAALIRGSTWLDKNANGYFDVDESFMPGVTVTLRNAEGEPLKAVQTGTEGIYSFEGLRRGEYTLQVELPADKLFADPGEDELNSCIDEKQDHIGITGKIILNSGDCLTRNIGGIEPGTLGDTVWWDLNENGLQDYEEPHAEGIEVILMNAHGEEVSVTRSDEYGYYHFSRLRPGQYRIKIGTEHRATTVVGMPFGEIDNDVDPDSCESAELSLISGERRLNVDIGLVVEFASPDEAKETDATEGPAEAEATPSEAGQAEATPGESRME